MQQESKKESLEKQRKISIIKHPTMSMDAGLHIILEITDKDLYWINAIVSVSD